MDNEIEEEEGGGKYKGKAILSEVASLSALNLSGNRGLTIGRNILSRQLNPSTNYASSSSVLPAPTFDNLRRLRIAGCKTLKHILPISLSQALQQLEELVIISCDDLEEIIVNDSTEEKEAICKTLFPRLRCLELDLLKNLSRVSTGVFLYDWPSLEAFKIRKCPNLKRFPVNLRTATKLSENVVKEGWGEWFDGLEWDDKIDNSVASDYTKLCFLLCCMFPQGSSISRDDLLLYMVGEELFGNIRTLTGARNKLHAHLERLKRSCLLLDDDREGKEGCVRMHNDIRNVSTEIQLKKGFIVESGRGLMHWPDMKNKNKVEECKQLSLMQNKITKLPNQPNCPELMTLSLRGNKELREIPDGFFLEMKKLKTLDLENTCISSVPSSLQCLTNLRVLRVSWSSHSPSLDVSSFSLLGKLKNLEILHLQDSDVQNLPKEIGKLTNLKSLNLSRNQCLTIARNTLSELSLLEELNLEHSFHEWQIEEDTRRSEACFSEVTSLSALATLNLRILNLKCLSANTIFQWTKLTRFLLILGNLDWAKMHVSVSQCATGVLISGPIPELSEWGRTILLERVEGLQLKKCEDVQHVLSHGGRGFNKLRVLHVDGCSDSREYLLSSTSADEAFSELEVLYLKSLPGLKVIFHGSVPSGCFNKLRFLHVLDCHHLIRIICSDLLAKLASLEELVVWDCYQVIEIFNSAEVDKGQATMEKLKRLNLLSLPSLKTIWNGVVSSSTLKNLEEIRVEDLGLNFMFSPAMAQRLEQLKQLEIRWCREMKKIISMEEVHENTQGSSSSTQLDPSLNNISSSSSPSLSPIFGNLKRLYVAGCNSLKQILPMRLAQGLLQLEELHICKCSNLKEIIVNDDDTKEKEAMCKEAFPQLKKLVLRYLRSLSMVSKGMLSHDWPLLETLIVWKCPEMKRSPVSLQKATKLKEIVIEKEWFNGLKLDDKIKDNVLYLQEKGVKVRFEE